MMRSQRYGPRFIALVGPRWEPLNSVGSLQPNEPNEDVPGCPRSAKAVAQNTGSNGFHVPLFQPEITIANGQIDRFLAWHGLMAKSIEAVFLDPDDHMKEVAIAPAIYPSIYPSIINLNGSLSTPKNMANFRHHSRRCLRGRSSNSFLLFEVRWQWQSMACLEVSYCAVSEIGQNPPCRSSSTSPFFLW